MKKIIVTGGQGFIGSNLVEFLLEKNYFVINIDKSSYSANPYNVKDFKKNKKYIFYLDLRFKNMSYNMLKKCCYECFFICNFFLNYLNYSLNIYY